jgi:hypothetical protein
VAGRDDLLTLRLTRDEAAMLYTASFYLTNETPRTVLDHGPTPAQSGQLKLAEALDEDVPEAALQDMQRAVAAAQERAAARNAQLEERRGHQRGR